MAVEKENTNTFLQCQFSIRPMGIYYQVTGVTILRQIFWVNRNCNSANSSVLAVSTKFPERRSRMNVLDETDSILHGVHHFQRNREQLVVVFVAVEFQNVQYMALVVIVCQLRIG